MSNTNADDIFNNLVRILLRDPVVHNLSEESHRLQNTVKVLQKECEELRGHIEDIKQKCNTRLDFKRSWWSWLRSGAIEAILYSIFSKSCNDVIKHYDSPEIAITGTLAAYLCSNAEQKTNDFLKSLESHFPGLTPDFELQFIDCQKNRDIGGADFAVLLNVELKGVHSRFSFAAFQAKKHMDKFLSFSINEREQLIRIRHFTHASYYILYKKSNPPIVVPARALYSYLCAKNTYRISEEEIIAVALQFADYIMYDFLPGWSGDDRSANEVEEFVTHVLRPIHILKLKLSTNEPGEGGMKKETYLDHT
jgi:hypothetical protein